jgi:hypothetical protein
MVAAPDRAGFVMAVSAPVSEGSYWRREITRHSRPVDGVKDWRQDCGIPFDANCSGAW